MSNIKPHIGPSAATAMRHVLKENMKDHVLNVREHPAYIRSLLRITAYKDHNKLIKDEFKQRIQILDEKYGSYTMWMDIVQVSIIVLAASSSFLQAGNDIINLDKAVISFISLIISSYTGLVLALAKYKKIDEKKETINNLRHQCADFLTQIQTRTDKLNTWCYDRMWAGGNINKMADDWAAEDEQLYNELKPLIEKKQALTCEFERILDSLTVKKTSKLVRARDLKYKKQSIEFTELEDNLEEKESVLESERKKKLQRAFYNTDYKPKLISEQPDSVSEIKESKNMIARQMRRIADLESNMREMEQLHEEERKDLIKELKKQSGGDSKIARSRSPRRGRSKTRSPRRRRRRSPRTYEEKLDNLSSSESGSGSETSDSEYSKSESSRLQRKANRLRELVKKREKLKKSLLDPFNHFSKNKEYFTLNMFIKGTNLLGFDLNKKDACNLFKIIDRDDIGKVYMKEFKDFVHSTKDRSLSPTPQNNEKYLEGDIIEAKYKNKGKFFRGKIVCESDPPGAYKIEFEDGDICDDILPSSIKLIKRVNTDDEISQEHGVSIDPTIPNRPFFREKENNDNDSETSLPQEFAIDMPSEKESDDNNSLTSQNVVSRFRDILRKGGPKIGSISDIFDFFSNRKKYITADDFETNLLDFDSSFKQRHAIDIFKMMDVFNHGKVYMYEFTEFRDKNTKNNKPFLEGDIIEAQYNNKGRFLKGKILCESDPPGLAYKISFDGGYTGDDILPSCIRLIKRVNSEEENINLIIDDPTIPDRVFLSKRREDFRWNIYINRVRKGIERWKNFVRDSKIELMIKKRAFRKLKKILNKKNDISYDSSGNVIRGEENV